MPAFIKILISLGAGALALLFIVPAFSVAQTYSGVGSVLVYVQVIQRDENPHVSGDFTASISGNNPTPATISGSLSGVLVTAGAGAYNVAITGNTYGYSPAYSQGCSNTVTNGQQQLCVITMTGGVSYAPPTPYQYSYNPNQQTLFCSSAYREVNLGMPATFISHGGSGSYTWATATKTFTNVGSSLTTTFPSTGTQTVTVTSNLQTATCIINVVASGAPYIPYQSAQVYPAYNTAVPTVAYVSPTYIPALPNTGFEPQDGATAAFAIVALLGAFGLSLPYVRKTFAVVLG